MPPLFDFLRRGKPEREKPSPAPAISQVPLRYEGQNFKMVEGFDDVKIVLERSIEMMRRTILTNIDQRIHVLLAGPPGIAKTMLLLSVEKEVPQEKRLFLLGSQVSKAGLRNKLLMAGDQIELVLIDELDKMGKTDYDVLLSLMQTGRITVLKGNIEAEKTCLATVMATANYLEKIPPEVLDRFMILYLPQYDAGDFEKVALRIFVEHGFDEQSAKTLARTMWANGFRSARDVLRVARYAHGGDLQQAMTVLTIMARRSPPENKSSRSRR
ncbi:MAG: AAA family ATPase [Candidatus Caldarchaeum sp.]|uniref:AAA family ATPase n=2 Tax=Caldiarchaeum subterraneum TaxID=311458 RepID=A0A7C4I6G9_CALS0